MPTVPPLWVPHILVVDDSPDFADCLARILGAWGFQPLVAYDGPSAVETALSQAPDAVLMDIALAGLDGYEVARRLRRHPGLEKTLLVAVTACVRYQDPRCLRAAGFDHLLTKPIDLKELRRLLAALG
jgi:CheY-like chemotaxis protein